MKKIYILFFALLLSPAIKVMAQVTPQQAPDTAFKPILPVYRGVLGDTTVISKGDKAQQKYFEQGAYPFPPKPRNMWELGVSLGGLFISGDVPTRGGYGGALYIRKAIGYAVSLRANFMLGTTYGLNWKGNFGIANNPVLNGDKGAATNYYKNGKGGPFFYNYKCNIDELTADIVFTLNNIGYHRVAKDRKFDLYGGIGGGGMIFSTFYNALDKNGQAYDFESVYTSYNYSNRKSTISKLKSMLDGTYETPAETAPDAPKLFNKSLEPVVDLSLGLGIHLSKRFALTITEKASYAFTSLLDGDQWSEHPVSDPGLVPHNDFYHFTSVSLGYFLGGHKRVEPLYWQNPTEFTYDALQTLVKKNVDQLLDTDNDGVPDKLDKEPNSAPGAIVDSHGVTKDSDHDGIPDYKDKSPYDPPAAIGHVDSLGVPLDSDGDGVPDYKDLEPNTPKGSMVDANGRAINPLISSGGGAGNGAGGYWFLPAIFFDLDKDVVKPEMYIQLKYISTVMAMHPELKIVAYGNTDVRASDKYNEDLSMRRGNHAKDYLVKTYGIDPSRIIVKWDGKKDPLIKGLPAKYDPKYEGQQYYNRRVEFRVYDPKTDK